MPQGSLGSSPSGPTMDNNDKMWLYIEQIIKLVRVENRDDSIIATFALGAVYKCMLAGFQPATRGVVEAKAAEIATYIDTKHDA